MKLPVLRRTQGATISATIEDGIARVLEKRSPGTPSFAEIRRDVVALHRALDLSEPTIKTELAGKASRRSSPY